MSVLKGNSADFMIATDSVVNANSWTLDVSQEYIDTTLECGATTNTAERRKRVAFSPAIFVTGTRLAVPRAGKISEWRGAAGRKVAVVRNTTNESAVREFDRLRRLGMNVVVAEDYGAALRLLETGGVAHARGRRRAAARVPRRDREAPHVPPGRRNAVVRAVRHHVPARGCRARRGRRAYVARLAQSREIVWIYNRWFLRALASGRGMKVARGKYVAFLDSD